MSAETRDAMASDLVEGDAIANVGVVNAPPRLFGVFVLVETYASEWSLFTGKAETKTRTHVFHRADVVLLDTSASMSDYGDVCRHHPNPKPIRCICGYAACCVTDFDEHVVALMHDDESHAEARS